MFRVFVLALALVQTSTTVQLPNGQSATALNLEQPTNNQEWSLYVVYKGQTRELTRLDLRVAVERKFPDLK